MLPPVRCFSCNGLNVSGRDAKRMCCRRMKLGHEDSTALLIAESGPHPHHVDVMERRASSTSATEELVSLTTRERADVTSTTRIVSMSE